MPVGRRREQVLLVAGLLALASPARGGALGDLARHLDRDAPVILKLKPKFATAAAKLARRAGGSAAETGLRLGSMLAQGALGFDPLSPDGWEAAGFSSGQPILVQLGALDVAKTGALYRRLAEADDFEKARARALPVLWRFRLVAVADARELAAALSRSGVLRRTPGREGGEVVFAARALGGHFFLRERGKVAVLDFAAPFAGFRGEPARLEAALAALGQRPAGGGLAAALRGDARRVLRRGDLALWADPARVSRVLSELGRIELLRRLLSARAAGARKPSRPDALDPVCRTFTRIAEEGPIREVAVAARAARGGLDVRLSLLLRDPAALRRALPRADDGLAAAGKKSDAGARLFLAGTRALRELPRPGALSSWDALWSAVERCPSGLPTLFLAGWPQLAGLFLDELSALGPEARALVERVRNLAFAARHLDRRPEQIVGGVEISLAPGAEKVADMLLDEVFAARRDGKGRGAEALWGRGPVRPYRRAVKKRAIYGAGFGARSVAWLLRRAPAGQKSPPLFRARTRLEPLSRVLAGEDPERRWLWLALGRLGSFRAEVAFRGDVLEAALRIQ